MAIHFDKFDAEFVALRQLVARLREHHPDWTLEQCAHEAVEQLADPEVHRFVSDEDYRAFLLARLSHGGDEIGSKRRRPKDPPPGEGA